MPNWLQAVLLAVVMLGIVYGLQECRAEAPEPDTRLYDFLLGRVHKGMENTAHITIGESEMYLHSPLLPPDHPKCRVGAWMRGKGENLFTWIIATCGGRVRAVDERSTTERGALRQIRFFTNWANGQADSYDADTMQRLWEQLGDALSQAEQKGL